jgi:hypothetical protein
VGIGNLPYLGFIKKLIATGRRVICMDARHISMRWCSYIPTPLEVAEEVLRGLRSLGVTKVRRGWIYLMHLHSTTTVILLHTTAAYRHA